MKVLARQLTVDLYNCKSSALIDTVLIQNVVRNALLNQGYATLHFAVEEVADNHCALMVIHSGGHLALHIYKGLLYVSADIFICHEQSEPEEIYKELKKYFKPEKMRSTFLKRGDFGRERDVKPKIKTRMAPLRKIHNTGAKVVRILARRDGR